MSLGSQVKLRGAFSARRTEPSICPDATTKNRTRNSRSKRGFRLQILERCVSITPVSKYVQGTIEPSLQELDCIHVAILPYQSSWPLTGPHTPWYHTADCERRYRVLQIGRKTEHIATACTIHTCPMQISFIPYERNVY